jgi:hypothetical protein
MAFLDFTKKPAALPRVVIPKEVARAILTKPSIWDRIPTGAKIGAGVGAGALLVFGAPAIVPVGIAGAVYGGYKLLRTSFGGEGWSSCMTPERVRIYQQAVAELKDPAKLRGLADMFEQTGCAREAEHLRKRARLRDRTPDERRADKARYKAAMSSSDVREIEKAVSYFQGIGADGCVRHLRLRIKALKEVS